MNELIESHLGYAHALAADLAGKYPPNITRADLEGAAEFGLVQAARNYDPSKNVSFATFAYYRIRGAIFDEVRKSWHAHHSKDGFDRSTSEEFVETATRQKPYPSWEEVEDSDAVMRGVYFVILDSSGPEPVMPTSDSPADRILKKEESEAIQKAIRQLPKRHRLVLQAHYYEDFSFTSIGGRLNLSKSWVSRIHAQALSMVRKILQESRESADLPRAFSSRRRRNAISLQATFCSK